MSDACPSRPPGVSTTTGTAASLTTSASASVPTSPVTEVRVPIRPGVEQIPRVVGVHQVDASGDRLDPIDQADQLFTAGVGVAGVQAETDGVATLRLTDGGPQPLDPLQPAGHGIVTAGGVLDQQRNRHLQTVDAFAPVVEAGRGIVVLQHVPAVHDHARGPDARGRMQILLQELAAGDADPVVGGRHVEHVRRVHVEGDPGRLGGCLERVRAPGVRDLRALPGLWVAQEELGQRGLAGHRLSDRIDLVPVPANGQLRHGLDPSFGV